MLCYLIDTPAQAFRNKKLFTRYSQKIFGPLDRKCPMPPDTVADMKKMNRKMRDEGRQTRASIPFRALHSTLKRGFHLATSFLTERKRPMTAYSRVVPPCTAYF
jgi:hypothetical protein